MASSSGARMTGARRSVTRPSRSRRNLHHIHALHVAKDVAHGAVCGDIEERGLDGFQLGCAGGQTALTIRRRADGEGTGFDAAGRETVELLVQGYNGELSRRLTGGSEV
jgi:hypothetical protein